MDIAGSCHCGNIRFRLAWEPDPQELPARACTCSFCVKHGGLWTSNPQGRLRVSVREPEHVRHYAFGTKTARFHICSQCGAVPLVTSDVGGKTYAVVSVNAFDNVDPAIIRRASITFDAESEEERLARRARNWIPHVEFVDSQ
jgi:hypothetical protein